MSKLNLKNQKIFSKTKRISVIIIIFLSILILGGISNKSFAASNVIEISTAEELLNLFKIPIWGEGMTIRLTKDIDLDCSKDKVWSPINGDYSFMGTFDGNNHTISNMYIKVNNKYSDRNYGFFGTIGKKGCIKNTNFLNCKIEKYENTTFDHLNIGIVVGESEGIVQNCKTSGCEIILNNCNIKYEAFIGGITGRTENTIINCSSGTKINLNSGLYKGDTSCNYNNIYCGGIVGYSSGRVSYCINRGEIINKLGDAGGIVGVFIGEKVVFCKNTGKVNVESKKGIVVFGGGIIGQYGFHDKIKTSTIYGCGNNASIKGKGYKSSGNDKESGVYLGGIIGSLGTIGTLDIYPNLTIRNSYSIGNISLDGKYSKVKDSIKKNGSERRKGYGLGGIIGFTMFQSIGSLKISNVYSVGTIQNTGYAGAIFGRLNTDYSSTVNIKTSNIFKTSTLKDKGNEDEKYGYVSKSSGLGKERYIRSIKTNSTTKSWNDMKSYNLPIALNKETSEFGYDKYKINGGYPCIKQLEKGWKTLNGKKYYFVNGEYVTGLRYIAGKQYYFDKNGILDEVVPKVSIKYSTQNKTKGDVQVTITANEEIQKIDGWSLLKNKKVLTKTFTSNATNKITIRDLTGNSISKTINVNNIDKEKAKLLINYTKPTKGKVQVTISANEEIKNLKGWKLSKDKKVLTKTYNKNIEEKIKIQDLVGNETTINIVIKNIEK